MYLYAFVPKSCCFSITARMDRSAFGEFAKKYRSPKTAINIYSMSRRASALFVNHKHVYVNKFAVASEKERKIHERKSKREKQMIRDRGKKENGEQEREREREKERRRVAMATIKGADQTRRDEGSPFIADFVTQKPPPWNRRIRSLRATPPIHPLTLVLSSFIGAESILRD